MSTGFDVRIRRVEEGTYEIEITGEDDTIGHLFSTYLELDDAVQLSYYQRPHPLEERIIIYVRLKDKNADVKEVFRKVAEKILADLDDLKERYLQALERAGVQRDEVL